MAKCAYDKCQLPDNNKRFILQGIYVIIGTLILFGKSENFTFFQIILFIAPILIDILSSGSDSLPVRGARIIIGGLDVLVIIFCLVGLGGYVTDNGNSFSLVNTMLLFGGFELRKDTIGIILMANIAIPFIYYNTSPCKNVKAINMVFKRKEAKP